MQDLYPSLDQQLNQLAIKKEFYSDACQYGAAWISLCRQKIGRIFFNGSALDLYHINVKEFYTNVDCVENNSSDPIVINSDSTTAISWSRKYRHKLSEEEKDTFTSNNEASFVEVYKKLRSSVLKIQCTLCNYTPKSQSVNVKIRKYQRNSWPDPSKSLLIKSQYF